MVKESGYAGFIIPIEVHLKNHQTITIQYDLYLDTQMSTKRSLLEKHVVSCSSDEFRKRLLKGGGVSTIKMLIWLQFVVFLFEIWLCVVWNFDNTCFRSLAIRVY